MAKTLTRCAWVSDKPIYQKYHDKEWGVPVHNDRKLFEFLVLESAQAGLSWITILQRREGYRRLFANFDPQKVARFTQRDIERLVKDPSIIRNRQKIVATVNNARRFLEVCDEFGSFDRYSWQFVENKPIQNRWKTILQLPGKTEVSDRFAADLKKRGFQFLGSTIIYAHMQAVGMVNDHTTDCFRFRAVQELHKRCKSERRMTPL